MKALSITILLIYPILFAFSQEPNDTIATEQDTIGQIQYSFGQHGVEIMLSELWNPIQHSKDRWELLYGCSGTEKCPNIQVSFHLLDSLTDFDGMIDYVIGAQKKQYTGLDYTKSTMMINDIEFKIVDFQIRYAGYFWGQTVTLFETNKEWVNFVFTGDKNIKQAASNYVEARSRFMNILQSLKIVESEETATGPTSIMQLSKCNDTTSYLSTEMDSLKCYVKLTGKIFQDPEVQVVDFNKEIVRRQGGVVKLDNMVLRSDLERLETWINEKSVDVNEKSLLLELTRYWAAQGYYQVKPEESDYITWSIPVELTDSLRAAFIWYPVEDSGNRNRILRQLKNDKINNPPAILGNLAVSTIVDKHIFTIHAAHRSKQSIAEVIDLLSILIRSMEYSYNPIDYDLCETIQ